MHVICVLYTSILVSRINISDGQLQKFLPLFPFFLFVILFFLSHIRVPDFTQISGDFPITNASILIRQISQQDKSNRTNWTRKCSYIFPYLRLRNHFRITSNKLGCSVSVLFTCTYLRLSRFPSSRLNKPVSPFFRSVNTTT